MSKILCSLESVSRNYSVREGFFSVKKKTVRALDNINLELRENEIMGLVGESGCGKSTLARITLGLEKPGSGKVLFQGRDITLQNSRELKAFRQKAQMIFQDPFSSLNPKKTIFQTLREPLKIHGLCPDGNYRDRVRELLGDAGLADPDIENRYPHEFSGGQRQRIGLARALATEPELIIADEPTSALDVSIQAQIINLLLDLQETRGLSYLFISHDLPIIQFVSHRVTVMYRGQLMELMPGGNFLSDDNRTKSPARHPYTRYLLSAVPLPDPDRRNRRAVMRKTPLKRTYGADRADQDSGGCAFAPGCPEAGKRCFEKRPAWKQIGVEHFTACHAVEGGR
jgi:oligopeptide/dipeptide ABC transporter ATP-binding protein